MSTVKKNAVSRLFSDLEDELVVPSVPIAQTKPAEADVAKPVTRPSLSPVIFRDAMPETDVPVTPPESTIVKISSNPVKPASEVATATKTKVAGVKTQRARGRLSGFRAALGVQIILPLPQNVHEAYTRQCASENITLQSGVIDTMRDLVNRAVERPEVLAVSEAEAEKLIGWLDSSGTGFLRLVIPKDLAEAMDALPHKRLPDGELVSRKLIATRAVLNRVKARL